MINIFTNESNFINDSRKDANLAKKNLCGLGVLARENNLFHVSSVRNMVSPGMSRRG
jgi:hypothetical protein